MNVSFYKKIKYVLGCFRMLAWSYFGHSLFCQTCSAWQCACCFLISVANAGLHDRVCSLCVWKYLWPMEAARRRRGRGHSASCRAAARCCCGGTRGSVSGRTRRKIRRDAGQRLDRQALPRARSLDAIKGHPSSSGAGGSRVIRHKCRLCRA